MRKKEMQIFFEKILSNVPNRPKKSPFDQ